MREFDDVGLRLAQYQGKLFEESVDLTNYSSKVFLRRFFYSNHAKKMDCGSDYLISCIPIDGIREIDEQFGSSNFGKEKIDKNIMFWMGYIYRYISYTTNESTKFVMKAIPYQKMINVYYSFHTQSNDWVLKNLLIVCDLPNNYFDKNMRLKETIAKYIVKS